MSAASSRKRHKTRHPGVSYRVLANAERSYEIWYMGTDGKPRREGGFKTERDAVRARAKVVDKITRGEKVAPTTLKVKDWAPQWLESREMRENTRKIREYAIRTHIIPRLGRYRVCDLNVNHVAAMVAGLRSEGYKANTVNIVLGTLSGMMRTAVRRGFANQNPVGQLDRHERPQADRATMSILDSDEIRLLLANAGNYHVLLATLIFTGLRVSELLALRWDDVDWDEGTLHVRDSKTKAGVRKVLLMPSLRKLLAQHSLEQRGESVFQTKTGLPIHRGSVARYALNPALKRAGIEKKIRVHDLRHTYASILIHQKHSEAFICEQMGHSSISMTQRVYGHLFDREERMNEARDKLEAEFGQVLGK